MVQTLSGPVCQLQNPRNRCCVSILYTQAEKLHPLQEKFYLPVPTLSHLQKREREQSRDRRISYRYSFIIRAHVGQSWLFHESQIYSLCGIHLSPISRDRYWFAPRH